MLRKNFKSSSDHVSDEDLVRSTDGELSSGRAAEVESHLKACWECRTRMESIQSTITSFVRAHHAEFDGQLPPPDGPRALLRARLDQVSAESRVVRWSDVLQLNVSLRRVALAFLPVVAIAIGVFWFREFEYRQSTPNPRLTPGATHRVTMSEVCAEPQEQVVADVPVSLRDMVLREYGMFNARPEDYEIDYLIAPHLGGSEDIRNLWPQPFRGRTWNARVKDDLEERLHEMVCSGKLDLSTAQHDIAKDWIAAYKKYFHTDLPLATHSDLADKDLFEFGRAVWAYPNKQQRINIVSSVDNEFVFPPM